MALRNEIIIGPNPLLNNLVMYRKVDNKPFIPEFNFSSDNELDIKSNIEVRYKEYYKDANGGEIIQLTKHKTYVVVNYPETEDSPVKLTANNWFNSLSRTPILATDGIMDSIEQTLAILPFDVPNGYYLP